MDFTFSEEQRAAAEAAHGVFAGVAPDAVPSPALTTGAVAEGFDRALWSRLGDADLLSLLLAEAHGGAGLDAIALCLVLREAGRVLARVPLLEHCAAAAAVQAYGGPEQVDRLPARAGRGELVLTVAAQGRTGHDPAELAVTARREGRVWLLDGVQTAVPWAFDADLVVVPAHVEGAAGDRTVLALVPREADGLVLAEQVSTSGERLAELRLRSVRVDPGEVIEADGAWEWLHGLLVTGTCALALGLGERVLRMTAEYAGRREQFGYPLATFQGWRCRPRTGTSTCVPWRPPCGRPRGGSPRGRRARCPPPGTSPWRRSGRRRGYGGWCRRHSICTAGSARTPTTRCTAITPGPSTWS